MTDKKMTRKEALEIAIAACDNMEAVEVLNKMLASINKQANRPRSKSSARIQNEPMAREFIRLLNEVNEPVNAKWMTEHIRYCATSQKAVAIAKIAIGWGAVEKVSIKNRTYYVPVEGWQPTE